MRVLQRSRAALLLSNETTLRLDQGTTLTLSPPDGKGTTLLEQLRGGMHVITRTPRPFQVKTPFVNANVEGTEFSVRVVDDSTTIAVYEGRVLASNDIGSVSLGSGEEVSAAKGASPRKEIVVRPVDAVAWTLYFPTVFDYRLARAGADTGETLRRSVELYRAGLLGDALAASEAVPQDARSAGWLNYRAALLLQVGRLDAARPAIAEALRLEPANSDSRSLLAIVAVVENNKNGALEFAGQAVRDDPKSPAALIALSYAEQASFQLEAALGHVVQAVKLDPSSALAHARHAELELSVGRLDAALTAAQEAVRLDPSLAKTQSVLGFASLTRIDTRAARASFERAIELDSTDPLPRLGLGLAKIRDGDLRAGREEIEVAAALDPTHSLIRSYLGKAYLDEKRDRLAKMQFARAKEFDPNDPTAWFYDAVRAQAGNEPGEALLSIQASIDRNANRAVFRSKLLLDDDLAARSVNQASIYRQLGFDQLALAEGYKALSIDQENFSAHRFLADSYLEQPRHELARDNEILQARMWQPINLNPIPLRLSSSDAGLFGSDVLFDPGQSEYNRLYVGDGLRFQALALAGGQATRVDQILLTGVSQAFSYSLGQFHHQSNGFRANTQLRKDSYEALVQYSPSDRTNIHVELRRDASAQGDAILHFDPEFTTDMRAAAKKELARFGARQQIGDSTALLLSAGVRTSRDTTDSESFGGRIFSIRANERLGEFQIVHRTERLQVQGGVGFFSAREQAEFFGAADQHTQKSHNAYLYANLNGLPGNGRLTVGVSRDHVDDPNLAQQFGQTNYKAGVAWNLTANTSIRMAIDRVLKRAGLAELTIEPTQVMGFNQFFDDANGTDARRTALAIDHKFSNTAFAGLQLSKRDLRVPQAFVDPIAIYQWHERSHLAYLSFLPDTRIAINIAYRYDAFDRSFDFSGLDDFINAKTQRLPVTMTLTTSPNTSLRMRLTQVRQSGTFLHSDLSVFSARSSFAVADAMFNYRLAQRRGTVTFGVQNVFDRRFLFQEVDAAAPTIAPQRYGYARITLNF